MKAILFTATLYLSASSLFAQTKTLDDKNCHVTVPATWTAIGPHSARMPGNKIFAALVKSVDADDIKLTVDMIKQGDMASVNAKILENTAKRLVIQTEAKGANGKVTTHYQVMTKSAMCQGSVDFDDPADAAAARKIIDSTTGAQ